MTIYLAEKGISDIEVVEVEFPHRPELWPEGFLLKLNPAHSLPVLDTGKGALIGQSIAILEYLRELYPSPNMLGETPEEHAQARELVSIFEEATAFFGIWARQGSRLNADEDTPGALWSHGSIEASRLRLAPEMTRVVVAIDPAVTSGEEADETGIVVAGKDKNGHGYVLADISGVTRRPSGPAWRSPPTGRTGPTASWPRSTTAATWSGRRFAWSTQTWRLPRSAPRAARSCGPNRWRRSTTRAASITSAPCAESGPGIATHPRLGAAEALSALLAGSNQGEPRPRLQTVGRVAMTVAWWSGCGYRSDL